MKKIPLKLRNHIYPIYIGSHLLPSISKILKNQKSISNHAIIIADQRLKNIRNQLKKNLIKAGWNISEIPVKAGESLKSWESVHSLYETLFRHHASRNSTLFALGGGTVGDTVGFIAATFLRGIPWVSIPTTLLAQVDSSIGGKTGINHAAGKNLIGSFYQPSIVLCDVNFLKSLKSREILSGFGEMLKYGLIFDLKFYNFLKLNYKAILKLDRNILIRSIFQCIQYKVNVVEQDEFDQKNIRSVLNFGHTFAHALESLTRYNQFQHGEAVIWGMRMALILSTMKCQFPLKDQLEIDHFLATLSIPPLPRKITSLDYYKKINLDKKFKNGFTQWILLKNIGERSKNSPITLNELKISLKKLRGF